MFCFIGFPDSFIRKAMMIDAPVPQTMVVNHKRIILVQEDSRRTPVTLSYFLSLGPSSPDGYFHNGYCFSFR
jgi:hypothetical protein